jgi:hypothetical protein
MMTGDQEPRMPDKWIDTDAGVQRAEHVHRQAGILTRIIQAGEDYWAELDRRNSFRERWARATRRNDP